MKVDLSIIILALLALITPAIYLFSQDQSKPLQFQLDPIEPVVNGTLILDYSSQSLNDEQFQDLMQQIQQANDFQQTITNLTINVQGNQLTSLDISNLKDLSKLQFFTLNAADNILNGQWNGFENFGNMGYLKDIVINISNQGVYTEGTYSLVFHPSLQNIDFIQQFESLSNLRSFDLQIGKNPLLESYQAISGLKNCKGLQKFAFNATEGSLQTFKGFQELQFEKLNELYFTIEGSYKKPQVQDQQDLQTFLKNLKNVTVFQMTLLVLKFENLGFFQDFSSSDKIVEFNLNLQRNEISDISGFTNTFKNMKSVTIFELDLQANNISEISVFSNLENSTKVQYFILDFRKNQIDDISGLNCLENMINSIVVSLSFHYSEINDIDCLKYLGKMKNMNNINLSFEKNDVQSAEPLNSLLGLDGLQEIFIDFTRNDEIQGFSEFREAMLKKYPDAFIIPKW